MSNAILMWLLAYLLLPQVVLAGPLSTASLSPYLTEQVPKCAHRCVRSYISDNFHTLSCRDKQDLKCLCTSKGTSGFTLGEGALSCLASYCSQDVLEEKIGLYELCAEVKNARPMTHGTLTVTQIVPTTVALTSHSSTKSPPHSISLPLPSPSKVTHPKPTHSSTTGSSTSTHHTVLTQSPSSTHSSSRLSTARTPTTRPSSRPISSPVSSPVSTPVAPLPTPRTSIHPSPTTLIASPASSSAVPKPQRNLTTSQIAGVTVAGVASAALAFGVLFCIFCVQRKDRKRRNSGSSFGGDNIIPTRPGSPEFSHTAAGDGVGAADPERGFGDSAYVVAQERNGAPSENRTSGWSFWRRSTKPEEIGLAVEPQTMQATPPTEHGPVRDEAPTSATSYRTTSQLLPEKPTYSLFPQTLRVVNPPTSPVSPQSPDSAETRFTDIAGVGPSVKPAPRGRLSVDTSQRSLQQKRKSVRPSVSDPFLDSHSDAQGLVTSGIAGGFAPSPWSRSLQPVRKPVPVRRLSGAQNPQPPAFRSKPSLQIPSTYAGRPTYGAPEQCSIPHQTRGTVPNKRNSFARPATHCSNASDTSFEDADEDDEPTTAQPLLSPVAESPKVRQPPGPVRYPKVPGTIPPLSTRRPSPESPTRQPPPKNPKRALIAQATVGKNAKIPQPQVAELYGSPVSPKAPWGFQPASTESPTGSANGRRDSNAPSAKWQILVKPGLEGIEGASSPAREKPSSSPWSGKTGESQVSGGEWTPTKKGDDLRLHVR